MSRGFKIMPGMAMRWRWPPENYGGTVAQFRVELHLSRPGPARITVPEEMTAHAPTAFGDICLRHAGEVNRRVLQTI